MPSEKLFRMLSPYCLCITTAASCGELKVKFSTQVKGSNYEGVTGDAFEIECADGYKGGTAIVTCTPNGIGKSIWTGMPTCTGESISCAKPAYKP